QSQQTRQWETGLELSELEARIKLLPTQPVPDELLDEYLRGDRKTDAILTAIADIEAKILDYPLKYPKKVAEDYIRKELKPNLDVLSAELDKRRDAILHQITNRY